MLKKIVKSFLRGRGLAIYPYNKYREELEPVQYNWIKKLDIDLVFDVGASNGGFARKIRSLLPAAQIHSFEPLEASYQALKSHFSEDPRFAAHQVAVGDEIGTVTFYENEYSGSSSLLKMTEVHKTAYPFTRNEKAITVPSSTLDDLFEPAQVENHNVLLKMDVQGAEGKVLAGAEAFLDHVDLIFTEVSFDELYEHTILFNDIFKILDEKGFDVYGFENVSQSVKDGTFLQADAFFIRRDTAKKRLGAGA